MAKLIYKQGNLFEALKDKTDIVVPHVCNVFGTFGAGFAAEVRTRYPYTNDKYIKFCRTQELANPKAYRPTTLWTSEKFGHFANMICQTSLGKEKNAKYLDLSLCMMDVYCAKEEQIYCPKFGAGLCGLKWDIIEELISEIWIDRGVNVTVFTL